MSEEYEQGTAELLLSKPVTKAEYFRGQVSRWVSLIVFLVFLNMILSVISATITFGPQIALNTLPIVFLAQIFGVLIFFSVGFMFGEVVRRSSLSYIITSALFFTNEIVGLALTIIYNLTGTDLYRQIQTFSSDLADVLSRAAAREVHAARGGFNDSLFCLIWRCGRNLHSLFHYSHPGVFSDSFRYRFCFL